jgi:hypothetical protein
MRQYFKVVLILAGLLASGPALPPVSKASSGNAQVVEGIFAGVASVAAAASDSASPVTPKP